MTLRLVLLITALLTTAYVSADTTDTSGANNKKTLEIQHTEVWSRGNVDLIASVYTEDYVGHFPGGETIRGHEGIRQFVESHRISFPDWNEEILEIILDGDRAATRYLSRATHLGEFLGIPPTGNKIQILEASIYRLVEGRIAEQWAFPDIASLQEQLSTLQTE